jgi:hypothetical protein
MSRYSRLIIVLSVSGLMMLALILLASIQTRLGGDTIHWARKFRVCFAYI